MNHLDENLQSVYPERKHSPVCLPQIGLFGCNTRKNAIITSQGPLCAAENVTLLSLHTNRLNPESTDLRSPNVGRSWQHPFLCFLGYNFHQTRKQRCCMYLTVLKNNAVYLMTLLVRSKVKSKKEQWNDSLDLKKCGKEENLRNRATHFSKKKKDSGTPKTDFSRLKSAKPESKHGLNKLYNHRRSGFELCSIFMDFTNSIKSIESLLIYWADFSRLKSVVQCFSESFSEYGYGLPGTLHEYMMLSTSMKYLALVSELEDTQAFKVISPLTVTQICWANRPERLPRRHFVITT